MDVTPFSFRLVCFVNMDTILEHNFQYINMIDEQ